MASLKPVTLYSQMSLMRRALIGARWLLRHDGLGASNHFETGGFIRSRAGIRYPNIQFHFLPLAVSYDGSSLANEHGFQAHVGPMRSRSTGWVRLRSAEPRDKPRISFNYMSQPEDWEEMRACVRLTREIFAQHAFDPYRGREIQPGEAVQTDEQIDAFVRRKVESAYHPSCTCRMGSPQDPLAVVDPQARVIGLEACAWWTHRSCPRSPRAISTPRRSCWRRRPPTTSAGCRSWTARSAPYYTAADWETRQR